MKCPTCKDANLALTERQNIEIDYCPECRGVWLDRGELDKLIERAERPGGGRSRADDRDRYERHSHDDGYRHKRPKSFLRELFD